MFDPKDHTTWGPLLTVEQMAAIYQTSVAAMQKRASRGGVHAMKPAPSHRRPARWRKADVVADVFGEVVSALHVVPVRKRA